MYLFICTHHLHINTNLHQHHSPQQWLRLFSQGNIITECDCGWFSWTVCVSALTQYSVFRSFCSTHIKVSLLFYSCRIHKWKWWLAQTHAHVPTSEVECEALAVAHELPGRCSNVFFFLKRATLNGLWKWDHGQGSFTRCSWRRLWFFFFLTHWFSKGRMWLGQWVRGRTEARDSNRRCDAAVPFPPSADVQDWSDSLLLSFTPCLRWSSAPVYRYEPAAGWIRPHWKVSTQGQ